MKRGSPLPHSPIAWLVRTEEAQERAMKLVPSSPPLVPSSPVRTEEAQERAMKLSDTVEDGAHPRVRTEEAQERAIRLLARPTPPARWSSERKEPKRGQCGVWYDLRSWIPLCQDGERLTVGAGALLLFEW